MNSLNSITPLTEHTIILVKGPDAKKFLQGQVTCDIDALNHTSHDDSHCIPSSLGAHCTHKGRIVFTFRALSISDDTVALRIPNDIKTIALTTLKKYIVFSKAELIETDYLLFGLQSHHTDRVDYFGDLPDKINTATYCPQGIAIFLTNNTYEIWLTPQQQEAWQAVTKDYHQTNIQHWNFLTSQLGLAEVYEATTEKWTPHAINLQDTGNAVSFKKGCYTGQEVIARMHYLGKLKRQMFLFEHPKLPEEALPRLGDALYSPDKNQSIGDIVLVAENEGTMRILASVATEQVDNNTVYLDKNGQHKLLYRPLSTIEKQ